MDEIEEALEGLRVNLHRLYNDALERAKQVDDPEEIEIVNGWHSGAYSHLETLKAALQPTGEIGNSLVGLESFLKRDRDRINGVHFPEGDEGCLGEAEAHLNKVRQWVGENDLRKLYKNVVDHNKREKYRLKAQKEEIATLTEEQDRLRELVGQYQNAQKLDIDALKKKQAQIATLTAALEEARGLCKEVRGRLKADLDQGMSEHHRGTVGMLDAFIKLSAALPNKGKAAKNFRVDAQANAIEAGTSTPQSNCEPCATCGGKTYIHHGGGVPNSDCPACKEKPNPADDSPPRPGL